jgi:TonB family protein
MRRGLFLCVVLVLCSAASSHEPPKVAAPVGEFAIGLLTFFDFGPPFNYYEIFTIRPSPGGVSVQRITLTPPADECFAPAKVEVASASIEESPAALLESVNPCAIPEKEVRRELKRCKKCLVFSGAEVVMQFQCGTHSRLIHSSVLDRDWFSPSAKTPQHTSWSMQLLARLDKAVGPGVMSKPMFPTPDDGNDVPPKLDSATITDLVAGKYDALFTGNEKPSQLYAAATSGNNVSPTVTMKSSVPFQPELLVAPNYPPLARQTRIQGNVEVQVDVDADGNAVNPVIVLGHPLLQGAVLDSVRNWKFSANSFNQQNRVIVEFDLNCRRNDKTN